MIKIYKDYNFRRKPRKMPVPSCLPIATIFALLIMCIIAIMPPIITGIKVDTPRLNTQPIEIFDDFTYTTIFFKNDGKIIINNTQIAIDKVADAIKIMHKNVSTDEIKIFIKAEKEVSYNSIISLLQILNNAGFVDITLVNKYSS